MDTDCRSKRQLVAEQTKDKLFQAAESLLAEKSFEEITIRDIVARAHVAVGTFYNYYSSKIDVFYETYRVADHYFAETVAPLLTQSTAYERILMFFQNYAHYSCDLTNMKMTKLIFTTDNTFFDRDPTYGMVGLLRSLLNDGLECGELTGGDTVDEMSEYLMVATRGLVFNWCSRGGSYDLRAAMSKYVVRLLRAYIKD